MNQNQIESNENSKNVYECRSLIVNLSENVEKNPSTEIQYNNQQNDHHIDNQPHFIYENTIKFSAAIPQVNRVSCTKISNSRRLNNLLLMILLEKLALKFFGVYEFS